MSSQLLLAYTKTISLARTKLINKSRIIYCIVSHARFSRAIKFINRKLRKGAMGNKKGIWQLAVKQIKKTTMLLKIEKKWLYQKKKK